jgi:hypothetical protein
VDRVGLDIDRHLRNLINFDGWSLETGPGRRKIAQNKGATEAPGTVVLIVWIMDPGI